VRLRLVLAVALVAVLALGFEMGLGDWMREPARVEAFLTGSGMWGPFWFVLAFGLLEPFGVPGAVFALPAAAIWPLPLAVLLSWLGSILAGVVGFSFARFLARDWVAARLPPRLRDVDARIALRPLATVIVVRLTLFLFPPAHWALGLTRVGFVPFVLGTAIGFLPGITLLTVGGRAAWEWLGDEPLALVGAALLLGLGVFALRRLRRRYEAPS
jgi:uncharacterized membrane protein YdjX (TVP38/TMEM64 family)